MSGFVDSDNRASMDELQRNSGGEAADTRDLAGAG
jgi:hypothetical protein